MSHPVPDVTDDAFLGDRLHVLQPVKGHRAGLDAMLLAASVSSNGEAKVLDVGAGSGVVGLAIAARLEAVDVTGIEIEPELVALANENARRNGLADRVRVITGDVTEGLGRLETQGAHRASFDIIVSNPPFLDAPSSRASPLPLQARASTMPEDGLARWARFYAAMARPDGALYLIHRADALRPILDALDGRFGALAIRPLHPRAGEPARRLIVQGRKGSRAPLRLLPGLVLHAVDGTFVAEVERVLRSPEALAWP